MKIILVIAIIVLLFGGKKIPELMKGLGGGIKEFKNAAREDEPTKPVSTDPIKPSDPTNQPPTAGQ